MAAGDPFTPDAARLRRRPRPREDAGGRPRGGAHTPRIHGVKWLQAGSGYGKAPQLRLAQPQAGGISEQFTLTRAGGAALGTATRCGSQADYAYSHGRRPRRLVEGAVESVVSQSPG
ncbi:MAG: hypothetical protein MZW92_79915 [Comamonadaceae bacterium]|nr:hypothetical protein [Comamonadaceae bacterium]